MREILRLVVVLGLIGACSAAALSAVRDALAARIDRQNDFYVRGPALERLFGRPADELLGNKVVMEMDGRAYPVFYLMEDGKLGGLAVEAPGRGGYGGDIIIMIGADLERNRSLGVEIVSHSETPGVGAQVEKASFRQQWEGLDLSGSLALRSEGGGIDAITGATYSSKAMVDGSNQVLTLVREHIDEIRARIDEQQGGATP